MDANRRGGSDSRVWNLRGERIIAHLCALSRGSIEECRLASVGLSYQSDFNCGHFLCQSDPGFAVSLRNSLLTMDLNLSTQNSINQR